MSDQTKKAVFIFSVCLSIALGLHGWHTKTGLRLVDQNLRHHPALHPRIRQPRGGSPALTFELARYLAPLTTASGIFLGMSQFILYAADKCATSPTILSLWGAMKGPWH